MRNVLWFEKETLLSVRKACGLLSSQFPLPPYYKVGIHHSSAFFFSLYLFSLLLLATGFVQSSFNGASLYKEEWGLHEHIKPSSSDNWKFGATNAVPFFVAALVGCPLSLPINYWFGRRGGICVAAFLILAGSIGAAFAKTWYQLFGIRIVNGIGMSDRRMPLRPQRLMVG